MKDIFNGLDLPEEVKTELTARIEKEVDAQKEGVKNDPDFINKIRKEESGKFFKSQEKIYKKIFPGLKINDIDGEGLSRMEAIGLAGVDTLEKSKDATNQELQQKYFDVNAEFEKYKSEVVPGMLSEKDAYYQETFIEDGVFKDCVNIDSTIEPEFRPALVDAYCVRNGIKKVWDSEKKGYEFMTLDNVKPTKDGKPMDKMDIITEAIDRAGGLKKSNGTPPRDGDPPRKRPAGELSANAQAMLDSMPIETRSN